MSGSANSRCEVCGTVVTPVQEMTCEECMCRTCEECGRTVVLHTLATSTRSESWQCNGCEFDGREGGAA